MTGMGLDAGGTGATAYADAVAVYLAFAVDQIADRFIDICRRGTCETKQRSVNTFGTTSDPDDLGLCRGESLSAMSAGNLQ